MTKFNYITAREQIGRHAYKQELFENTLPMHNLYKMVRVSTLINVHAYRVQEVLGLSLSVGRRLLQLLRDVTPIS